MNELTVYHFMSDKLNLYSDIGNIIALKQRAKKRNIKLNVKEINETDGVTFDDCDIFSLVVVVIESKRSPLKNLVRLRCHLKKR